MSVDNDFYCSFCGKHNNEVFVMIAGPTVFICDECSDLVVDIVKEQRAKWAAKCAWQKAWAQRIYETGLTVRGHKLYTRWDTNIPSSIKDRNGDIALGLCKVCNAAEIELEQPCTGHLIERGYGD